MTALVLLALLAAPPSDATLDQAKAAIEDQLDFQRGAQILHHLLEKEDLPVRDRRSAYRMLAPCEVARNRHGAAVEAYVTLLILEPDFEPAAWRSPKVRAAFRDARVRFEEMRPRLAVDPPIVVGQQLIVTGTLDDPHDMSSTIALRHRVDGATPFDTASTVAVPRFEIAVPIASRLSYFVEVRGQYEQQLAAIGSGDQPLLHSVTVTTTEAATTPWYGRWWVWTVVGVAVAGGVTAAVVAGSGSDRNDLFEIRLPP